MMMRMGRARLGVLIGVVAAGGVLGIGLADCAEPTQIEIDVRTDACAVLKNAGIAVTTPDRIDEVELTIFTPKREPEAGCEAKPPDRVGTLIVYPSGSKDAEIGIRIVAGIDRAAHECKGAGYAGCIVARRVERFAEGSTKKVIVILSRACVGKDCGRGAECTSGGQCVDTTDGGAVDGGPVDGGGSDATGDAPTDGPPPDVIVDSGADACASCSGPGTNCNSAAGTCTIDCAAGGAGTCASKPVCGPGLACTVNCNAQNACSGVSCAAGSKACTFDCTTSNPSCTNVSCFAPSCLIKCGNPGRCTGNIDFGGGDAGLICSGTMACSGVNNAVCDGGRCLLTCSSNCPNNRDCDEPASDCTGDWP